MLHDTGIYAEENGSNRASDRFQTFKITSRHWEAVPAHLPAVAETRFVLLQQVNTGSTFCSVRTSTVWAFFPTKRNQSFLKKWQIMEFVAGNVEDKPKKYHVTSEKF